MKSKIQGAVLLCEYCHQPFSCDPHNAPPAARSHPEFTLCPRCGRHWRALVPVTCAQCGDVFPRLRSQVKMRRRYCQRAFCPACHTERTAPKTVKVTCSDCGRSYTRTRQAEYQSQHRGCQRRICPICQPAKMVLVTCWRCRRQFPRKLAEVRKKQREGKRRAMCPRCHDRSTTMQPQPKGDSK